MNEECKIRPQILNINSNGPSFYAYSAKINKCNAIVITSMIHMKKYLIVLVKYFKYLKYLI